MGFGGGRSEFMTDAQQWLAAITVTLVWMACFKYIFFDDRGE